jgi:pyruvate/2-oxoglutarate dehydrogenase complex dihydrolipoamide acyltransferase (E2) component
MGGEGDKVAPGGLTELITGGEADQQLAPDTQKPTEGAAPKPTESAQMPTAPAAAQPKAPQVPEIPTVRPPGPTAPPATASEGIDWGALGNTAKSVAPAAGLAGLGYLASQLLASPLGMGHSEDLTEQEAESRALKRKLMALGLGGAGAGLGYYYGPQITGALTPKAASDQLNCQQFFSSTIPCPLDGRQVSGMVRKASEEALHPSSEADNDGPRAKCQRAGVRSRGWVV